MLRDLLIKIKPYFFDFHTNQVWKAELSEIKKTRAHRKCTAETKSYLNGIDNKAQFQSAFKNATNPEVGLDLMKRFCPNMVPESDFIEFFGRAIPSASTYMKIVYEELELDFVAPMNISHKNALERADYIENDETNELYERFKAGGLNSLNEDLHFHNSPMHLLLAAQSMQTTPDMDLFAMTVPECCFNDLCKRYISLCIAKNGSPLPFSSGYLFLFMSDIFQLMYINECAAYAILSKKSGSFVDFRPYSKRYARFRWAFFWKIILLEKWFPFTYPMDEAEFQKRLENGEYEND